MSESLSSPILLSIAVVAALLSISERSVKRMLAAGALTYVKVGGRTLIRKTDLDEYVSQL